MSGADKIIEAAETVATVKQKIQDKYDKIMGKILKLQKDLDNLANDIVNHTEAWIEEQRIKIQNKINKYRKTIEDWMKEQLRKIEEWLEEVKKEIEEFIQNLLKSMVMAIMGM